MLELSVDQQAFQAMARHLGTFSDGKKLRRKMATSMRKALEPVRNEVRQRVLAMPSSGTKQAEGAPLRRTVAAKVRAEIRLTGKSTGARLKAMSSGMPRGFRNAPKRLNSRKGWRHKLFGRDIWFDQVGEPRWFDEPPQRNASELRLAVLKAMNSFAAEVAARAK